MKRKVCKRGRFESGVSMLYVLAALIVTGFIGTALLKTTSADSIGNAHYSCSASARSMAKSGTIAAITELEQDEEFFDVQIELLQNWIDIRNHNNLTPEDRWIIGSENEYEYFTEQLKFRTEILAFDSSNFNITLRSEGVGQAGARASIISVYHLDGIQFVEDPIVYPEDALYLGGNSSEIMSPFYIEGSMYAGGEATFNTGTNQSEFNGAFRTKVTDNNSEVLKMKGPIIFREQAYFGGKVSHYGGDLNFYNGVGFERFSGMSNNTIHNGNVYFNEGVGGQFTTTNPNSRLYGYSNGNYALHHSIPNMLLNTTLNQYRGIEMTEPMDNIRASLGFPEEPSLLNFNSSDIESNAIWISEITGRKLNDALEANQNNLFNDEWLIVKTNGGSQPAFNSPTDDEAFTGKVIIMFDRLSNYGAPANNLYPSTSESISLLCHLGEKATKFTVRPGRTFRGFIYSSSMYQGNPDVVTDVASILQGSGGTILGGIYMRGGKFRVESNSNSSDPINILYSSDMMEEIGELRLFSTEEADALNSQNKVLVKEEGYTHIEATLISQLI